MKRIIIGLAGAVLLLGGLAACSTHGPDRWNPERAAEMRGKMLERVSDRLELNAQQKGKLDILVGELEAQRQALRGKSASPRDDFKAVIAGDTFDRSKAQELLDQKMSAVQQQAPKVLTAMADFYDSLDPAQQQKVRERLDQRRGGWRMGRHGF